MIRKSFHFLFPNWVNPPTQKQTAMQQILQQLHEEQQRIELAIFKQQITVATEKANLHRLIAYQNQLFDLAADQEATIAFTVGEKL